MQLENVFYSSTRQHLQVSVNHDDTMPVYSTLSGSSVETPQYTYTVINNIKKEQVSSEVSLQHTGNQNQDLPPSVEVIPVYARPNPSKEELPPQAVSESENVNESGNEESRESSLSGEVIPVFSQPDLSKKELSSQAVNETKNMNKNPNEEPQKLSPSVEVMPIYAQPDLSKKKLQPQAINKTENVKESTNEEFQELPPSEVVKFVYDRSRPVKEGILFTPELPLNPTPPPIPPQDEAMHYT